MKKRLLPALFVFSLVLVPSVFAKISVEFSQGSVIVNSPDGNVKLLDSGEPVPEIQDGSTIEVFQGEFKISTGAGETVGFSCGGNSGTVGGSSSALVTCGESSGTLEVLEGTVTLTDANGNQKNLKAGDKLDLEIVQKSAEPAAAEDEEGAAQGNQEEEPDSRSIEASVSQ